jgi:hypothetical protein
LNIKIFNKWVYLSGKAGDKQDDINYMDPAFYQHPKIKPFFLTPKTQYLQRFSRVFFDGTNYLIVWVESHYTQSEWLLGCRVTPKGKILDTKGFPIHKWGYHIDPRVACGKDYKTGKPVYLVIWRSLASPGKSNLWGVKLNFSSASTWKGYPKDNHKKP